jgi:uncharacterized membrane protein
MAEWDPCPFILLNLVLSLQAAYTAPIIMMSQNRQASIDRRRAMMDSEINLQAALEIKSLHQKVDGLLAAVDQLRENLDTERWSIGRQDRQVDASTLADDPGRRTGIEPELLSEMMKIIGLGVRQHGPQRDGERRGLSTCRETERQP